MEICVESGGKREGLQGLQEDFLFLEVVFFRNCGCEDVSGLILDEESLEHFDIAPGGFGGDFCEPSLTGGELESSEISPGGIWLGEVDLFHGFYVVFK